MSLKHDDDFSTAEVLLEVLGGLLTIGSFLGLAYLLPALVIT